MNHLLSDKHSPRLHATGVDRLRIADRAAGMRHVGDREDASTP